MMEKAQNSRKNVIFLFAAIFLIALSMLSYVRINNLIAESEWVNHTQIVKIELEKISTAILDAETNQKSYLLTGDSAVLVKRDEALKRLNIELNRVDSLIRDNATQIENLKTLHTAINLKLESMKKVLRLYTPGAATPEFIFKVTEGVQLTKNIIEQVNKMQSEENRLLIMRSTSFSRTAFITPLLTIVLIISSIIILIGAFYNIDKLNKSLEKSKDHYRLMVKEVEDYAILYLNREGIIENWNEGAEKIKGYTADEIIGKNFSQFYREEDRNNKLPEKLLASAAEEGKAIHEGWRVRKNGSLFWASIVITAIHNNKNEVIGFTKVTHDLTDKKAAEEIVRENTLQLEQKNIELKSKAMQLEEAQQLAHIGSWEWDVPANKIEWSDELYRIYGLTPQEFKADYENFLKYIHPDDRDYVNSIVQQAFKDQQPFNFSHKVICPDGTQRVLSSTGKVFVDSNSNTTRMAGTAQDITKQRKYETELKESEERFLKIFDYNPIPITLTEIKTNRIKYANKLFYAVFGYNEEEVIGHTSEELNLIGPEENERLIAFILDYLKETRSVAELRALSREETEALLIKLRQSDAMKNFEVLYTRKNGETFPAQINYEIMRMGDERYTITSYQDITDRKKAQEQLEEQKAFAELVIDSDPAMILAYDENLRIIAWNKKSEEGTGIKKEDAMGKHPFDLFPEYNNEQWKSAFNSVLKEGKVIHYSKVPFKRIKGYGEFWLIPLRNSKREIVGILSITRDISETIEITSALEQKNSELQRINKELESFNFISSHDLQEPLRQIQNFASRIITDEQQNLSDKGKNYFNKINISAHRMQMLIADLLEYSRAKTEEKKFEIANLNEIVEDVTEELKEIIDEKNATIEVGEMGLADVIPFQFRQLMHNIIGNALKFSKPEIPPHIIIKNEIIKYSPLHGANPSTEKEYCHITISDNGIGFEPQYKDRIFEVFQRLHDKQKMAGTGIGLAIVKKIVENHNGVITATSELNKGATFNIYIPTIRQP